MPATEERKSDICPRCEKFQFDQKYFDKNGIEAQDEFDCPVCGAMLYYFILCKAEGRGHEEYIIIVEEEEDGKEQ